VAGRGGTLDRVTINQTWERVAAIAETAVSADGYVEVTVDARGAVVGLVLDPRLYREPDAESLAATVVATADAAAEAVRERVFAVMRPLLPPRATADDADLAFDPVLHHLESRR
jgi:DNA-binding protein YbaB